MTKARDLASASIVPAAVSVTELGYIDGVTSAIQTQMNAKAATAATINPTIVDAKGDLIAATADNAVSRLAVGANDTILTADSAAATGMKWAAAGGGGMTLLSTTTLSGTSTTISSISQSYKDLQIVIRSCVLSTASPLTFKPNSANCELSAVVVNTAVYLLNGNLTDNPKTNYDFVINLYDYTTAKIHNLDYAGSVAVNGGGQSNSTSAITSIEISTSAGTPTFSSGTVLIYGVN